MVTIHTSYEDEPKDHFELLDEKTYRSFYDIEMSSFNQDLLFYTENIPSRSSILELGCGTGRLSQLLLAQDYSVTGVDISKPMLQQAKSQNSHLQTVCMDICNLHFNTGFDAIIAPYNVLNLLTKREHIDQCLQSSHTILTKTGFLLAEIATVEPGSDFARQKKSFQFQIFDSTDQGRVIKEIKRHYSEEKQTIEVEERYRLRPKNSVNKDYSHTFTINALPRTSWENIFHDNGFKLIEAFHNYDFEPYDGTENSLLAVLQPF